MERKIIKCKKCKVEFETKLIRFTKTEQRCLKNEYKIFEVTKTIERPQYTKCELCRNMQKAVNYMNKIMVSEFK